MMNVHNHGALNSLCVVLYALTSSEWLIGLREWAEPIRKGEELEAGPGDDWLSPQVSPASCRRTSTSRWAARSESLQDLLEKK